MAELDRHGGNEDGAQRQQRHYRCRLPGRPRPPGAGGPRHPRVRRAGVEHLASRPSSAGDSGRIDSRRVGTGRAGTGRVGIGRVGSRRVGIGRVGSRRGGTGRVGSRRVCTARQGNFPAAPEPTARRLLRVGFGLLWIFDGILQAQASMPLGMAPQVIRPAAATAPAWVQHLVNVMATTWSYHPIAVPAATVWIQVGIGTWLLVAPLGRWSRLGGLASIAWGLAVWIFGEAFGGILAPGLTWMFGAPGAVLFYCVAGLLVALPERSWATPRLGRVILAVMGVFFVGMALLQAWPGRGFWQGRARSGANPARSPGWSGRWPKPPAAGHLIMGVRLRLL